MARMSVSKYQTLRTCPRLFYWEHVLYMQRVRQEGARDFGKLYHLGLEAWWREAGKGDAPWVDPDASLLAALRAIAEGAKHVETDRYDQAMAEAMMVGYHARWFPIEYELVGKGVEEWFEIPMRDPDGREVKGWTRVGKTDAFVQFADQTRPKLVEHKHTTQDVSPGSDYWSKLAIDLQPSMYVDAAVAAGYDVVAVLYDVSKKPKVTPQRETPEAEREYTIGKGCKDCGGSAKPGEVKKGSGITASVVDGTVVDGPCASCDGTGWKKDGKTGVPEAPRPKAGTFLKDEPVLDFKARVSNAIAGDPESLYKHGDVPRKEGELAEARGDMVAAAVEIDAYYVRARAATPHGDLRHPLARQQFPRNTAACQRQFGRLCDWLPVCSRQINPHESNLYQIKQKGQPK